MWQALLYVFAVTFGIVSAIALPLAIGILSFRFALAIPNGLPVPLRPYHPDIVMTVIGQAQAREGTHIALLEMKDVTSKKNDKIFQLVFCAAKLPNRFCYSKEGDIIPLAS